MGEKRTGWDCSGVLRLPALRIPGAKARDGSLLRPFLPALRDPDGTGLECSLMNSRIIIAGQPARN